jgi:very-short-patch-repair endonuclease
VPRLPRNARNLSPQRTERARRLRSNSSISEKVFWERVRDNRLGFRFHREYCIGDVTVDFYCAEAKVVVEIDGEQHDLSKPYDASRDAKLATLGILVVRIPSLDLFEGDGLLFSDWLNKISQICEERTKSDTQN